MINAVIQGLGPIGRQVAQEVCRDKNMNLVGAVDINHKYVGKDITNLFGIGKSLKVTHANDAAALFKVTRPDVLVLATATELEKVIPSIEMAVKCGVNVVCSSEKVFNLGYVDSEAADNLDAMACKKGVRVLGTGVNPGCLLDSYVVKLVESGDYDNVFRIEAARIDDTRNRRLSLLEKTGVKKKLSVFEMLSKEGKLGHSGLESSADYIARKMGYERYEVKGFRREPVFAKKDVETKHMGMIYEGQIAGLKETCNVEVYDQKCHDWVVRISLELQMYAGAQNMNSVKVNYNELARHDNLVNGDEATVRILHNAIKCVTTGYAGLNSVYYRPDPAKLLVK